MKRLQIITGAVLVLALLVMGADALILPLPDWAVRLDGVVLLCALPVAAFAAVRSRMEQ